MAHMPPIHRTSNTPASPSQKRFIYLYCTSISARTGRIASWGLHADRVAGMFLPMSARAMGDETEILPALMSASSSLTI